MVNKRLLFIVVFAVIGMSSISCISCNHHTHIFNKNIANSVDGNLDSIIDNVDLNNYSEVTAAITAIEKEIINNNPQKRDEYYQRLFNGNFERFDIYRDGGSKEITLKDGTIIYQNLRIGSSTAELGRYRITKPNGTIEYYNNNGKLIKK